MLKKSLLSLAIAASMGLAGCSGTDSSGSTGPNGGNPDQRGADQGSLDLINNPGTYPLYDPGASVLPIPSDLQYSGTTDGTIVFSGETTDAFKFIDPTTETTGTLFNPVTNALADMDGASVLGQIDLPFSGAIDASTVVANQSVFLVPLVDCRDADGNDLDPITECLANGELTYINPSALDGTDAATISESFGDAVEFRADVIDQADKTAGSVLRISPLEPLDGASRYMVFLTNGIKTLEGDSVNPSVPYNAISGTEVVPITLNPVRSLVHGYEQLATGFVATTLTEALTNYLPFYLSGGATGVDLSSENRQLLIDLGVDIDTVVDVATLEAAVLAASAATPSSVVMSYSFTTGGTNEVLSAMAAPGVANSALQQNHALDGLTGADLLAAVGGDPALAAGVEALRNLPAPKARTVTMKDGAQTLVPGLDVYAGTVSVPYYLTTPSFYQDLEKAADSTEQLTAANVIKDKWQADDSLSTDLGNPALAAPSTKVTRFFPFAKETSSIDAPISVYLPANALDGDVSDVAGVVLYQHGITSNRSAIAPIATQLIANNYVVVGMDLTLHGLEPDDFVDTATGLIDSGSTGVKLSPLSFTDPSAGVPGVDTTAKLVVTSEATGATPTAIATALAAVDSGSMDPTDVALANAYTAVATSIATVEGGGGDADDLAAYTGYSTAVLGQYMLSENHFGLTTDDGSTPRAISADDITMDGAAVDDGNESGSLFVYLLHHQITRDNLRQSVMNLLNLGASVGSIEIDLDSDGTADLDLGDFDMSNQVHFVGHSLGSIIGTSYVSINNTVGYYNVNNNPIVQGAIAQIDTGTPALNGILQAELIAELGADNVACGNASTFVEETLQAEEDSNAAVPAGTAAAIAASDDVQSLNALGCGNNALPHIQTATLANGGAQLTKLLENSAAFSPSLLAGLGGNGITQTSSSFETFMNIFQATIDSVDALSLSSSFSSPIVTNTTGVLHMEVSGDSVVPNGADDDSSLPYIYRVAPIDSSATSSYQGFAAPLAGTEPLMSQMGLANITNGTAGAFPPAPGDTPLQVAVRFTDGDHGSFGMGSFLTTPETVDSEMAAQIIDFIGNSGFEVEVGTVDSTVIETQTTP